MQFGKRLVQVSILSGSIVRVWGVLESVLQRHEHMLNKSDRTMRVVRVEFPSGGRLIGQTSCKTFPCESCNMNILILYLKAQHLSLYCSNCLLLI